MSAEPNLEGLLASVADGTSVDWDGLEQAAPDADARDLIRQLRELAAVADAHRTVDIERPGRSQAEETPSLQDAGGATLDVLRNGVDGSLLGSLDNPYASPAGTIRRWGRFTLRERLGQGSFGAVYRAWDPQLERDVAVKLIHPEVARRGSPSARLLREGRAIAKVRHENVVAVFGVERHDDQVGLCMEYVQGRTIEDVVQQQGAMSAFEAAVVGERVCGALAAVHAADLVHRDVKARNVMREDATGRIVLMDFGSGLRVRTGGEGAAAMAGTPLYMAPELFEGEPASVRSDVYSVGVLLYFLMTGRFPVEGASLDEIQHAHQLGKRHPLGEQRPDVPADFARVVERALDANPVHRHSNAASLLHDLVQFTGGTSSARQAPGGWRRRAWSGLRAHWVEWCGAAAAVLLLVVALGFLSSWTYNYMFGIEAEFIHDTPLTWLQWGVRSLVAPVVVAASLAMFVFVGVEVVRLVRKVSPSVDDRLSALARAIRAALHRTGYGPATALASAIVLASFAFLALTYFGAFADLAGAVGANVTTASDGELRLLAPSNHSQQRLYRQVFTFGLVAMGSGWFGVWWLAREHQEAVRAPMIGAGIVSVVLALMLLQHPYRILVRNLAERTFYGQTVCYIVGETTDKAKLFCPLDTPRTRVVSLADAALVRSGEMENIFTPLAGPLVAAGR